MRGGPENRSTNRSTASGAGKRRRTVMMAWLKARRCPGTPTASAAPAVFRYRVSGQDVEIALLGNGAALRPRITTVRQQRVAS